MKQKPEKFDNLDRTRVISEIQRYFGVKLQRVGRRFKWLRDESGRNWWVLGGIDTWHGIPEEMMEDERRTQVEGVLVIAYKKLTMEHRRVQGAAGSTRQRKQRASSRHSAPQRLQVQR